MRMFRLGHVLAGFAVVLLAGGYVGEAHADFKLRIDCRGTGGNPGWAPTTNVVQVQVKIDNVWQDFLISTMTECDRENSYVVSWGGPEVASDVDGIKFYISGANTFWIDKLALLTASGNAVRTWGVDNNVGYCLSTDPADGANSECYNGVALNPYSFPF